MSWRAKEVTERQIEVMHELGIDIPASCSRGEASRLIGLAYNGPAHPTYVKIAEDLGIDTSEERSRDDILDLIAADILAPGREDMMCQWYAYRVYRRHIGHVRGGNDEEFFHPAVLAAAEALLNDQKAVSSVRRSIASGGLMQFSATPNEDATASTNTLAYRVARATLRAATGSVRRNVQFTAASLASARSKIPFPKDVDGRYPTASTRAPPAIPETWQRPPVPQHRAVPAQQELPLGDWIAELPAGVVIAGVITALVLLLGYAVFG